MRILVKAALLATALAGATPAAAITPAITYSSTDTLGDSRPFTLGYAFSLSSPVTVDALGIWAFGDAGDYAAGIWTIGGSLIVSTTVLATDPVQDNFRWGDIAATVLAAGDYVIGGEYRNGQAPIFATGIATIPAYSWIEDRQESGAGLNFPTNSAGGYGDNGLLWVNFSVAGDDVPAPAALALFGLGVAALGLRRR